MSLKPIQRQPQRTKFSFQMNCVGRQIKSECKVSKQMNEVIPDANNANNTRAIYVFKLELAILNSSRNQ